MNRTETKITYGLRDPKSGKFLRLEIEDNTGKDFCGEETVRLSVDPWNDAAPRFEVEDVGDLLRMSSEDPAWFNSSRTRPAWGRFEPAKLLPTRYETTLTYDRDGEDADPVAAVSSALFIELPVRFHGSVHRTRDKTPANVLQRAFGEAYAVIASSAGAEDYTQTIYAETVLIDTAGQAAEPGMMMVTPNGNTGQIDAIVPVPEGWPQLIGDPIDLSLPTLRLALARINKYAVPEAGLRSFRDSDFLVSGDLAPSL